MAQSKEIDWDAKREEILARIDPRAELEKLGLRIPARAKPTPKGWLAVHSPYREDKSASASLFVGTGPFRGFFVDRSGGEKRRKSFWQVYIDMGGAHDFRDAFSKLATQTGIRIGKAQAATEDDLEELHQALLANKEMLHTLTVKRGITLETAKALKLGWSEKGARWAIPVRRSNGTLINIKLHQGGGGKPKWFRSGTGVPLFGADRLEKLRKESIVVVTEGELDAILCEQATGMASVSATGGCMGFQAADVKLFHGFHVVLCYDSDAEGRAGADRTAQLFQHSVEKGEVRSLRVVRLYDHASKERKDVTDFLVKDSHTPKELQAVLDGALPYEFSPVDIESGAINVTSVIRVDTEECITFIPGDSKQILANFWLEVVSDLHVMHQDGKESRRIGCILRSKNWKQEFEIPAADFVDDRLLRAAMSEAAGTLAAFDAKNVTAIRMAGLQSSKNITRKNRIQAFGVLRGAPVPTYVSPTVTIKSGKVIASVDTGVEVTLAGSSLHQKAAGRLDLAIAPVETVRVLLGEMLEAIFYLYDLELGGTTLANVVLAIAQDMDGLEQILDSRVTTWVVGPSGCGKTDLALLAMRFFGVFTKPDIPCWSDTANAVEREMAACNSAVIVADDWKGDLLYGGELDRAKRVVQSYASGRARLRLKAGGDFVDTPPIRAQLMITGEDEPEGQTSIKARGLQFDAKLIKKDIRVYRAIREASRRFNTITPFLVAWLQRQGPDKILEQFNKFAVVFESAALDANQSDDNLHRLAANLSLVAGAFKLLMNFAEFMQVPGWDVSKTRQTAENFVSALTFRIPMHLDAISVEKPAEIFLETIKTLLSVGACRIARTEKSLRGGFYVNLDDERVPTIGFLEPNSDDVFIVPNLALAIVNEHLRRERGTRLRFSAKAVGGGLSDSGYLFSEGAERNITKRFTVNGSRLRCWHVRGEHLNAQEFVEEDEFDI